MFASLTAAPLRVRTVSPDLTLPTAWLPVAPSRRAPQRLELAPHVWILRERQWLPVTVLGTMSLLPWDDTVEPTHRAFPFPDWHEAALCRAPNAAALPAHDEIFFGVDDTERPALPPTAFRASRALCSHCPVKRTCLTWALEQRERFGVWAGTTGRQRALLQLRIKRGERVGDIVNELAGNRSDATQAARQEAPVWKVPAKKIAVKKVPTKRTARKVTAIPDVPDAPVVPTTVVVAPPSEAEVFDSPYTAHRSRTSSVNG